MAWTFCTSGAAVAKAGKHVSSISGAAITMANWSDEAEGYIETMTGKAFLDNYSSLPTGVSGALSNACSSLISMQIASNDTTGYLSRESDTIMNVQDTVINKLIASLKDYTNLKLKSPL